MGQNGHQTCQKWHQKPLKLAKVVQWALWPQKCMHYHQILPSNSQGGMLRDSIWVFVLDMYLAAILDFQPNHSLGHSDLKNASIWMKSELNTPCIGTPNISSVFLDQRSGSGSKWPSNIPPGHKKPPKLTQVSQSVSWPEKWMLASDISTNIMS